MVKGSIYYHYYNLKWTLGQDFFRIWGVIWRYKYSATRVKANNL